MNISNGNARGVEVSQGIVKCVSAGMLRRQIKIKSQRCRCSDEPFNLTSFCTGLTFGKGSNHSSLILPPGAIPHCCLSLPLISALVLDPDLGCYRLS